jgi:ComEC/Rec2-related protein
MVLSAYLIKTFHSKTELPQEKPLIVFIESFQGYTPKHLHYRAKSKWGDFSIYSKEPIDNAFYLINDRPEKGFNDKLVLFVDQKKRSKWNRLIENDFQVPVGWVAALRNRISQRWSKMGFSSVPVGFFKAVLLGDKSQLEDQIKSAFQQLGLAHILAISGMHFGLFYVLFHLLSLFLPFKLRMGSRLLLSIIYAVLSGLSISVVRALIFILLYELGIALRRPINRWQLLLSTALICVMIRPYWIYNIGFQLSFTAVLGIFVALSFLDQLERPKALKKSFN